jgi:stage III sporulation protein AC
MELSLLLKIGGIGILVALISMVLSRTGRDDLATFVSVAGILLSALLLLDGLSEVIETLSGIFGL